MEAKDGQEMSGNVEVHFLFICLTEMSFQPSDCGTRRRRIALIFSISFTVYTHTHRPKYKHAQTGPIGMKLGERC